MTLSEIKAALVSGIRRAYPEVPVYGIEVKEGYQKPSFFVSLSTTFSEWNTCVRYKECSAEIVFMQRVPDEAEALDFFGRMEAVFSPKLVVGERQFNTDNFTYDFIGEYGEVPVLEFDFAFYDRVEKQEPSMMMEEVELKEEM